MKKQHFVFSFGILFLALLNVSISFSQETNKIMIVIIDGARYSETFGDNTHEFVPKMWEISKQGTFIDSYYNDGVTYTSSAIPALWCGAWTEKQDTVYNGSETFYVKKPTLFEYYRKQKNKPSEACVYVLKYISSLWLPSFDDDYGPEYWPDTHSQGSDDKDVAEQTEWLIDTQHPDFLLVYLADTDHEGHSGNWNNYTHAIHTADSIVGALWDKIQADPFYKDQTTLFVTNDHGRHDDAHGGFKGHGDGCEGCRHIQFLAAGPKIKKNFVSKQYRTISDMAVTAAHWLGVDPEKATGDVMYEIFEENAINEDVSPDRFALKAYPNPFTESITIQFKLDQTANVQLKIFDLYGRVVKSLVDSKLPIGLNSFSWNGTNSSGVEVCSGVYFYSLLLNLGPKPQVIDGRILFY